MTTKECYDMIGGDYEGVLGRMMRKESLVVKFAKKFLEDGSYQSLKDNLAEGNVEEAFRAAHTLKGVAQNLGFVTLYEPGSMLADILRGGSMEGSEELMAQITEAYEKTVAAVREL
ncbi:MAG: Hpt domain-containing protein [Dorea sp.]|jgi:HPt (histidine-containing phosphotransfer) domain-containing protein|nr:Hpt domain-containing protein [Dorea sp.]MCI9249433.1 Hpt domain-containing protein [Dorea sp.]